MSSVCADKIVRVADIKAKELVSCGIGRRYAYISPFSDMRKFLAQGRFVAITGDADTKKSEIACAILSDWLDAYTYRYDEDILIWKDNKKPKFMSAVKISSCIKDHFKDSSLTEEDVIERYIDPYLLVIDDIGKISGNTWTLSMFFQIIDERWNSLKPTVFTVQGSYEDLVDLFAQRGNYELADSIASRIFSDIVIESDSVSLRQGRPSGKPE